MRAGRIAIVLLSALALLAALLAPAGLSVRSQASALAAPAASQPNPVAVPVTRPTVAPPSQPEAPDAAFAAALAAYAARHARDARLKLGGVHRLDEWAYAVADYLGPHGEPVGERFAAFLGHYEDGAGWRVAGPGLTAPREYNALLARFPDGLLDQGTRAFLELPEAAIAQANLVGHKLPWPAGQYAYVSQIDVEPNHVGQVDFDILGLTAAGDVYASKAGQVAFVKECSHDGACDFSGHGKANLVVIEHGPLEYSWYLHLAYNSVPVQVGDWVAAGTRLGVEGDTGYACGVHLHYMASTGHTAWTDPTNPNVEPWATGIIAVDFEEAPWSTLEVMKTYISANVPPPFPGLQVVRSLAVAPQLPLPLQPVTAEFTLQNAGAQAVTLPEVAALGRGPGCADWTCANVADFPGVANVTLEPGQEYTYRMERTFAEAGGGYFAEPAYRGSDGAWHAGLPGGGRVFYSVGLSPRAYLPLLSAGGG